MTKIDECKTCGKKLPKNSHKVWHTFKQGLPITNHCSKKCADSEVRRTTQEYMKTLNEFFGKLK